MPLYERRINAVLAGRLAEPRRFMQVIAGPRQVGKTTAVTQVLDSLDLPHHYATADSPALETGAWIEAQWKQARALYQSRGRPVVLALDEVQKVPGWSSWVKLFWDADTLAGSDIRVVILGSSPLLMQRGPTESLAGRFEVIRATHWDLAECREALGWDLDTYLFFGGYPASAEMTGDLNRWRRYVLDALVETSISRDIIMMARVDKPAVLHQVLHLACEYSGQVLSYRKMIGGLTDAGGTQVVANHLRLLAGAGLATAIPKYSGSRVRRRASSPKVVVMNTGLMNAVFTRSPAEALADTSYWGRVVESSVGAALLARSVAEGFDVYYWRDGDLEVDFVLERGKQLVAIEVKSGEAMGSPRGLQAFRERHKPAAALLVGAGGVSVESFLAGEVELWR